MREQGPGFTIILAADFNRRETGDVWSEIGILAVIGGESFRPSMRGYGKCV